MGLFGGSDSTNREMIAWQKDEALKAEMKEAQRQQRLKHGRDVIAATFDGGKVGPQMDTRKVYTPGAQDPRRGSWGLETFKPEGAAAKSYNGIGQDFYENYRKSLEGFYNPQVENQFQEAKSQNLFDLARKGLIRSSVAADRTGDLVRDRADANTQVRSEIEGQVTGLKSDVNSAKQRAYGLLTSTEDPTTAANLALTEVNGIQTRKPNMGALGDMFASALNSYSTFRNAQAGREAVARVPTNNPDASSGRNYA